MQGQANGREREKSTERKWEGYVERETEERRRDESKGVKIR